MREFFSMREFFEAHPYLCVFLLMVVLVVIISPFMNTAASSPPPSPQQQAADDEERMRVATAGTFAGTLKQSMRDPDSFKLASVLIVDDGAVCYTYRAKNGFNGVNVGNAVLSPKGKLKTDEMSGFTSLWNKECANKSGHEEVRSVSAVLDHFFK